MYWPKLLVIPENTKKWYIEVKPWECFDATFLNSKTRRWRAMKEKSNCLTAANYNFMHYSKKWMVRKLTPIECERLQTLPDNYTDGVSNTQRYKMIGNWWTVDVVAGIFENLK
jgi:site-specific DNA-cytosine methylase